MATPRCFFALVLVVALAIICAAQSTDPVGITITTQNSVSPGGLIQFVIKANASIADSVDISLLDEKCASSDSLFRRPNGGYGHVYWDSTCTTKNGYITGFSASDEDDCEISFDLQHLDANDEVSCYLQWRAPLPTPTTLNLTLNADASHSRVRLAAPVALNVPTPLDGATEGYTLGDMAIKFVQGKNPLWAGAPKQMTKDKIVVEFANAKLRPFTQYSLEELRLVTGQGDNVLNILNRFSQIQIANAYVAKDIRLFVDYDGYYYLLTAANPPSTFQIEFAYSNFMSQYYFQGAFTMASVDEEKGAEQGPRRNSAPRRNSVPRRGRRAAAAVAASGEEFKNFFAKRQQQIATLSVAQQAQEQQQFRVLQSGVSLHVRAAITPVVGEEEVVATSAAIPLYKSHELFPAAYPQDFTISLPETNNATIALQRTFGIFTTQQNITIDLAMSGYEWGFKNAQDLLAYYGATAQLAYMCGYSSAPVPFNITAKSITGQCVTSGEDSSLAVTIIAVVSAAKALKPFRIPLTIDGRATHFEFIPSLDVATKQPFTKFTNTELVFNVAGSYPTQLTVSGNGASAVIDVDTNVEFSTPVVYQWDMDKLNYMTTDTLECVAYNGNKKLSVHQHAAYFYFQDKKVDVKAKAGDTITITCTAPLNPNGKDDSSDASMTVITRTNTEKVSLERDEQVTNPNEDWTEVGEREIYFEECIKLEYLMSPAPKTVAEAKQRVIKLLNTAKWLESPQGDILSGLKNLGVKDVMLDGFSFRLHESPKLSALTAANGLDKVMEFNSKFPAAQVFGGEDDRMYVYFYVNTTAAPGFSNAINALRFTALNREEGFEVETRNERTLGAAYEITTFNTADPAKTLPDWEYSYGWACSTAAQCGGPCVNGKCLSSNVPFIWAAVDLYHPISEFDDFSKLYDTASSSRGQSNTAFAVGGQNAYYVVAMAAVAVVAMMF